VVVVEVAAVVAEVENIVLLLHVLEHQPFVLPVVAEEAAEEVP
jgi:hypothetical protein